MVSPPGYELVILHTFAPPLLLDPLVLSNVLGQIYGSYTHCAITEFYLLSHLRPLLVTDAFRVLQW